MLTQRGLQGRDSMFRAMESVPRPRIEPVNGLRRLRGLSATSWEGALDVGRLPDLEWLGVAEADPGDLDGLWAHGHDRLHHLAVGKYREPDLGPLASMQALTHVSIGDSHWLHTLEGIGQLPSVRHLDLFSCWKLASLVGIEAAASLQHAEISGCRGITDL